MNSTIAHFARLQETTSQCEPTLCHAVFPVLRLPALLCRALCSPASQCAPGLNVEYVVTVTSHTVWRPAAIRHSWWRILPYIATIRMARLRVGDTWNLAINK